MNQDVEPAETIKHLFDRAANGRGIGRVRGNAQCGDAFPPNNCCRGLERGCGSRHQRNMGAFTCSANGNGAAHTRARPADQQDLIL